MRRSRAFVLAALLAASCLTACTPPYRPLGDAAPAVVAGERLVWSDEFDGDTLSAANWTALSDSTFGDGNQELACLTDSPANLRVSGGQLLITAQRTAEPVRCGDADRRFPDGRSYTSAMITTQGKHAWRYGTFAMRAVLPIVPGSSAGLWPAFWLRPAAGTDGDGELDVVEGYGEVAPRIPADRLTQTCWFDESGTYPKVAQVVAVPGGASPSAGFHVYAATWTPQQIVFSIDGVDTFACTQQNAPWLARAFDGPFYLRLNLAVGGTYPGAPDARTTLPATLRVDWVRVYQQGTS